VTNDDTPQLICLSHRMVHDVLAWAELGYLCLDAAGRLHSHDRNAARLARLVEGPGRGATKELAARFAAFSWQASRRPWRSRTPHGVVSACCLQASPALGVPPEVARVVLVHLSRPESAQARSARRRLVGLPKRRRQVAEQLVFRGGSYDDVCAALGMKRGTLRTHVTLVYRAFRVQSRAELQALFVG
jgi:DNA-binding CsgD family transcriptional regulator